MKKMLAVAMASTLALSLSLSASAAEPDVAVQDRGQRPAQMEMVQRAERSEMGELPEKGERPEGMTRPEPTEEQMTEMESKRSEMEIMKLEKMAELEVAAQEAGLTLEEYMETLRSAHCPQMGKGQSLGVKEGQFKKMGQQAGRR